MIDSCLVESMIRADLSVEDCAVRVRHSADGAPHIVAYVQVRGPWAPDAIETSLKSRIAYDLLPQAWVQIARMPLTAGGLPDDDVLRVLPVVTGKLLQRCEELANATVIPGRARVLLEDNALDSRALHLSNLIPAWKSERAENRETSALVSAGIPLASGAMAFSDGGPLQMPVGAPETLTDAFVRTAAMYPGKGVTYVTSQKDEAFESYAAILGRAKRILGGLQAQGLGPGDSVILQIDALRDHFASFWACILGGIHPVVVAVAPTYEEPNAVVMKLCNTWRLLRQPPILASASIEGAIRNAAALREAPGLRVLAVDNLEQAPEAAAIHRASPGDVVFFQLTSGSTGIPKCIQETHRGILHHIYGSSEFNGYKSSDIVLNWLPLDHVVPTLTVHLKDVCLGCAEVQVKTDAIAADPLLWIELLDRHEVTHTWAPNFGFKIVSEALASSASQPFDLSRVKRFMNAGEQVTVSVIEDFLSFVRPFGVAASAMQPSFGMAEACTCMTYRNDFNVESGTHWISKASLGSALLKGTRGDRDAISFVDLGPPIPGVQIRIADHDNNLLPEGVIGRFQIKGAVVTPGYLHNERANREAFVGNGWFNTGDLGFIVDGSLTLTGREKEMIIIRGANFYCYEIEDVVNRVEGVEPTFSAACAADDGSGSECLAVFFVGKPPSDLSRTALVKAVRSRVASELGVTPSFVVPLSKDEFPKTTSGKIQRSQLKQSLSEGRYGKRLADIDIELANSNTIPDWFYRSVWRRREVQSAHAEPAGQVVLLFDDGSALAQELRCVFESRRQSVVRVLTGSAFRRVTSLEYAIDCADGSDYLQLWKSLSADELHPSVIVHLWTCSGTPGQEFSIREDILTKGVYSLMYVVQALAASGQGAAQRRLLVVSTNAQNVRQDDIVVSEKAMVSGLVRTVSQELPAVVCSHLDLPNDSASGARCVLNEIDSGARDAEVAYRGEGRWIPRLERAFTEQGVAQDLPFKPGAFYLISGGAGGIGIEIASHLVKQFGVRVLAIGRRPKDEVTIPEFLRLRSDSYRYETADASSPQSLRQVVDQVSREWGTRLDGVFHLAADYHECALVEETSETLNSIFRPKVYGAAALHSLLEHDGGVFVHFSSVTHLFGGAMIGAYAATNRFLDAFAHRQRTETKIRSYCFDWSTWEDIGLSKDYPALETLRARGYEAISIRRGVQSLLAGMSRAPENLIIGLDDRRAFLRQYSESQPVQFRRLVAHVESDRKGSIETVDDFGSPVVCAFRPFRDERRGGVSHSALEHRLVALWKEVLQIDSLSIHDNFFELGGNSLLLAKLEARIHQEFGKITVVEMFRRPTIAKLAEYLGSSDGKREESGMKGARDRAVMRKSRMRTRREPELAEIEVTRTSNTYGSAH